MEDITEVVRDVVDDMEVEEDSWRRWSAMFSKMKLFGWNEALNLYYIQSICCFLT